MAAQLRSNRPLRQRWQALAKKWTQPLGVAWQEWFGEADLRKRRQVHLDLEPLEKRVMLDSNIVKFGAGGASVHEYDGNVQVTIVGTAQLAGSAFSVSYSTADGTAVAGTDYSSVSGTVNFPASTVSTTYDRSFNIPIIDEGDGSDAIEQFTVNLSSPSNCTIVSPGTETITINPGSLSSWSSTGQVDSVNTLTGVESSCGKGGYFSPETGGLLLPIPIGSAPT